MKFQVIEDLASETSPSDSNNSADSAPEASSSINLSTAKRKVQTRKIQG